MATSHRAVLAAVAALAIAGCDAPTVANEPFGYDPRLPGGLVYHWAIGSSISVYVDPSNQPGDADLRSAVITAFEQWNAVIYYQDFALRLVDRPESAQVIVHHFDAPFLVDVSECIYPDVGAAGVTFFCPSEAGDALAVLPLVAGGAGRVTIDVRVDRARVATPTQFRALVAHEIGHVLGIGAHSDDPDDLLWAGLITATAPSERDARTLRWVLRQPADIRP